MVDSLEGPGARETETPGDRLRGAVIAGDLIAVESLLNGAPSLVNSYDLTIGWTPLHWAVQTGKEDIVTTLLARGAAVNPRDKRGWTPLRLANKTGKATIAAYLSARGGVE
jgi:ribonuclease L